MKKMLIVNYSRTYSNGDGYESGDLKYQWFPMAIIDSGIAEAVKAELNEYSPKELYFYDVKPMDTWDADSQLKFATVIQKEQKPLFLSESKRRCNEVIEAIKALAPANESEDKDYVIEKKPMNWVFYYQGNTAIVKNDLAALPMLEILLKNPNKIYTASALRSAGAGLPFVPDKSNQSILEDAEAVKNLINNLQEKYDKAKEYEKDEIQAQIDKTSEYYLKSFDINGKQRTFGNKDRTAIIQNFKTMQEKIKEQHIELYNHFEKWLNIATDCKYSPDTEIFWKIS